MKITLFLCCFFCILVPAKAQIEGIPTDGLKAFWSFTGNANDMSGNARHGTGHHLQLTKDRFGNENSAYFFNGDSSCIFTHYPGILSNKPRCISFWAVVYDSVLYLPVVSWGRNGGALHPGELFTCGLNYNAQGASVDISGARLTFEVTEPVCDGIWHHYVFQFNKKRLRDVEVYQDGTLLTHEPYRFLKTTPVKTRLGAYVTLGASVDSSRFFKGKLDDVAIYDRALGLKEILSLYGAPDPTKKPDYLKWLFFILVTALAFLLIFLIVRLRVNAALKKEKEKFELEKKWFEQENRVLKAQMDPHFIFNSLNSIQQFIIVNENDKAKQYLSTFSQLIKMQLERTTSENISLAQELEIIEKYLLIESLRFNNAFDYRITFENIQDTEIIHIPSLLIQPFIENALHHGLLPKLGNKELNIHFRYEDDRTLRCEVDDNGVGRKNPTAKQTAYKKKSLGVNFVQQRLANLSKIEKYPYGVEIIDKEDMDGNCSGTCIIIKIPIVN